MREIRTSGSMSGGGKRSTAETEAPAVRRKPPATATPLTYGYRARRRLYPFSDRNRAGAAARRPYFRTCGAVFTTVSIVTSRAKAQKKAPTISVQIPVQLG